MLTELTNLAELSNSSLVDIYISDTGIIVQTCNFQKLFIQKTETALSFSNSTTLTVLKKITGH